MLIQVWIGPVIAGLALAAFSWVHWARPWLRERRLRHPCTAHFIIRPAGMRDLGYVIQDDDRHDVRQLVLPSNSTVEIDIGIRQLFAIKPHSIVFGCDGDAASTPYATAYLIRYDGNAEFQPGADAGHTVDMHKYYHRPAPKPLNAGSHFNMSYRLVTRGPGLYKTKIFFLTDEFQASATLSILVEDRPRTRMKCIQHRGCYVRPVGIRVNA
jgi:hypothetical protein